MMPAEPLVPELIDTLPAVRGRLDADVDLARFTWFKVGGAADVLFRPADEDDLAMFMEGCPPDVSLSVIGNASNLLVRDGGIRGVVIRIGRGFSEISIDGDVVTAGAGAADLNVARRAGEAALTGLEFLSGIPGTVGGAVRMNAGAYNREMSDVFIDGVCLDRRGGRHVVDADSLGFAYRRSTLNAEWIVTSARLRGEAGEKAAIATRMDEIRREREATQPVRTPTGGSTFKNPPGHKAWELIAAAGCRGLRRGDAVVSEHHCNFLVNEGEASAADLEALGEEVRRRVFDDSGITLEWEIKIIGEPIAGGPRP